MGKHLQTGSLKTINGTSLEGTGDIVITSGSGIGVGSTELPPYSTSEILTSERWTDGKPIYQITVNCGSMPNATTKDIAIPNFKSANTYWVDLQNSYAYVSSSYSMPLSYTGSTVDLNGVFIKRDTGQIRIKTTANYSTATAIVTIKYTKGADTASSPVALVGSAENITTGAEYLVPKTIDGKQVYGRRVDYGYLPNAASESIAIPYYNPAYTYWISPSDSKAYCPLNQHTITLPTARNDIYFVGVDVLNSNIRAFTSGDYSEYYAYITLHYTK